VSLIWPDARRSPAAAADVPISVVWRFQVVGWERKVEFVHLCLQPIEHAQFPRWRRGLLAWFAVKALIPRRVFQLHVLALKY
jgi:hypothetical protein